MSRALLLHGASLLLASAAEAQTPIPPAPKDFATMAVQSDTYEVTAAQDALTQATDPRVRSFAQRMIADHSRDRAAVKQAAAASGLKPPPDAMDTDQARLLSAIQSLRGPDFDRVYVKQQVLAHVEAATVAGSFAGSGADPSLRRSAQTSLPMIQGHLQMAQQLLAALGGDQ
ncbi:DUF4142 domain-containing protein [Sphingomonas sp.]|uniref:DUF4142 domain-containing protein n=1 Tax=Sphingomonas sp. TaxID=28214 RepID=UPI0025CD872C|nr:DUF4142 domain-containing protein [Sphingomonas sp.]MBV9528157.1 DUF4142 domain-containing protein [Sphingomonas sp.]